MASGYIAANGVDTDSLFKAGSGGAATGFQVGGADLSTRYAPRVTAPIANTGFVGVGGDLANRFEKFGGGVNAQLQVADYWREGTGGQAQITWSNSGQFTRGSGTVGGANYTWLLAGTAAECEIFVSPTEGSFNEFAAPINTWLPLSSSRSYSTNVALGPNRSCTFNVTIRQIAGSVVLATAVGIRLFGVGV